MAESWKTKQSINTSKGEDSYNIFAKLKNLSKEILEKGEESTEQEDQPQPVEGNNMCLSEFGTSTRASPKVNKLINKRKVQCEPKGTSTEKESKNLAYFSA